MSSSATLVHRRRRLRRRAASKGWPKAVLAAVCAALALTAGAGLVAVGRVVFTAAADLAPATALESFFGGRGEERFRAPQLFDRSGEILLAEVIHPLARDRRWQPLDRLPASVGQATVAALDPTFWSNAGYDPAEAARRLTASILGAAAAAPAGTITERLAQQTLVHRDSPSLAGLLVAADIATTYSKDRVLEWFLNSADYGNLAFGVDAAARVYLGKPADQLTLGESAMLASLPAHPDVDPLSDPAAATALQRRTLQSMRDQGWITAAQERQAQREVIALQAEPAFEAMHGLGFVQAVWQELRTRVGAGAAAQGGAKVVTTFDLDLQLQADCVARSHLARMNGGDAFAVLPAADGSPCAAASLLPPLRPGASGIDHRIDAAATVLLNPASGEVLALTGPAGVARPAGQVLAPFIYLSAFSRGYTPATMIVDRGDGAEARGPLRLRTALASGDANIARRLADLLGPGAVENTLDLIGFDPLGVGPGEADEDLVRLADVAAGLGLLATGGVQSGAGSDDDIAASTILAVYNPEGEVLYEKRAARRSVISEGLAFLLNNILSDESARAAAAGPGSALDVGRPAATVTSSTSTDNWALGYTPQVVAGVWVGAEAGTTLADVHALNGAAPIWHALLRYASRDDPSETWTMPADVTELDVCDPSGYLPTPYCPRVVREVFLAGTEPTNSDTLYRPFRINKETGRLATYFTPLDQVDEVVFFVPPPEAEAWARATGVQSPPTEYDRIPESAPVDSEVRLDGPGFFDLVAGQVDVTGAADGTAFASYRLDVGEGLDPRAWTQIGEEQGTPVRGGPLGVWDTSGWAGAAIVRLTVVHQDGTITTAAVPVTVDNQAPTVEIVLPAGGAAFSPSEREVAIQVAAADETELDRVVVYVDDRPILNRSQPPWLARWPIGALGQHIVRARAFDAAGNWADSEEIQIQITR